MPWIFEELLIKGNPDSETAILTLWTPKEKIASVLDKNKYAVIGQLYSKDHGINVLIRNCLANKNIRNIVITGADLTKSGDVLMKLSENGVKDHKIIGTDVTIDSKIPEEAINNFRKNVLISDQRIAKDFSSLELDFPEKGLYGKPEKFAETWIEKPEKFPTDESGFKIKGKYIGEVWLEALQTIMRFGFVKKSQHSEKQKEILNLIAVITDENPEEPKWMDFYTFTENELKEYIPQVLSPKPYEGIEYTYGQRLGNQVEIMISRLKDSLYTRRAVSVTWNVDKDAESENPPCLTLVQALVQDDKLFLTAHMRSNDIFKAWPMNAYALRYMQYRIAEDVKIKPGSLTMISSSAHIYESDWNKAKEILNKNPLKIKTAGNGDPRGNILISLSDGMIKVTHLGPDGKRLEEFSGKTVMELCEKIALDRMISEISHALDIGCELQKAEIALKLGIKYEQDKPLNFH